jgi:hypothetical protein
MGGGQAEAASKKPQCFFVKNVVRLMLQPLRPVLCLKNLEIYVS